MFRFESEAHLLTAASIRLHGAQVGQSFKSNRPQVARKDGGFVAANFTTYINIKSKVISITIDNLFSNKIC